MKNVVQDLTSAGHEWMRAKWSAPIRKYWKISEQMMVKYCDLAICDSVNISKDFVKILFEAMSENNSDIAIANMKRTSRRDDKNTVIDWKVSSYKNEDALIRMLYGTPFGTSACGKLFKRSLFTGVEFPYGKFSEDLFTIYKTILKSENIQED